MVDNNFFLQRKGKDENLKRRLSITTYELDLKRIPG
jgi:hypothetical protein